MIDLSYPFNHTMTMKIETNFSMCLDFCKICFCLLVASTKFTSGKNIPAYCQHLTAPTVPMKMLFQICSLKNTLMTVVVKRVPLIKCTVSAMMS